MNDAPLRCRAAQCALLILLAVRSAAGQDPSTERPAEPRPGGAAAPHRLGVFLWHDSPNDLATLEGLRTGLAAAQLPHVLSVHRAGGVEALAKTELAAIAAARYELVFALGTQSALLARDHLPPDLPIVYGAVSNPVASGLVPSWQGSGRNLAGVSNWIPSATVLQAFRLALPGLRRLGMLRSGAAGLVSAAELATMRTWIAEHGEHIEIVEAVADDAAAIPRAVATLLAADVGAIWIPIDLTIYSNVRRVREARGACRVPLFTTAMQAVRDGAEVGVLVDYAMQGQRVGALALSILLDGKPPGSLPVETMRGYRIAVNLGAARRSGFEPPLSLLVLADLSSDEEAPRAGNR